jgi:hypothetical protein
MFTLRARVGSVITCWPEPMFIPGPAMSEHDGA